jgi:thymidine kinase
MIFVAAGLIIFLVFSNIDYREYRNMVPGHLRGDHDPPGRRVFFEPVNEVNRWIPLGFFNLQPAEFAKVVVIIALASLLAPSNRDEDPRAEPPWRKVGLAVLIVAVPGIVIYEQPDLGTAMVFGFILLVLLFAAGATWRQMVTMVGAVVAGVVAVLQLNLLSSYQMDRIRCLIDPTTDPLDICYQLGQSMRAIGSGQLFGKGMFSDASLTHFEYVPEQQTDFIFTAVGEQLGLLGGLAGARRVRGPRMASARHRRQRPRPVRCADRRGRGCHDHVPRVRQHRDDDRDHAGDRASAAVPQPGWVLLHGHGPGPRHRQLRLADADTGPVGEPAAVNLCPPSLRPGGQSPRQFRRIPAAVPSRHMLRRSQGGWVEVICGPMFSGKSEELIRRVTRSKIARIPVQVFKPALDDRYALTEVVSHSALKIEAIPVADSLRLLRAIEESTRVIGIDEAQFFDDGLVDIVDNLAATGLQVIVAGLDTDYLRRPFEPIPSISDRAEYVTKMLAVCHRCGGPGPVHAADRAVRRPGGARCAGRL